MPGLDDLDKILLEEQLEYFQIQRHDFLNNIQVIRGYLQLDMPERIIEYIEEILAGLVPQQEIARIGQKTVVAILLGWFFQLRLKGVEMVFSFTPEVKGQEFWLERWQEEYAQQFYGYTRDCLKMIPKDENPDDFQADIYLHAVPGGFGCEFKLLKQEELFQQKDFSAK